MSAPKYWVSVNNTLFCVLDAVFDISAHGGWKFLLLYDSNDSVMSLFTVLNSPSMRWFVSDCNMFT